MGCGGSKEETNPDEIKFEMKTTKVPEFDEFFTSASEFLENLENLRATFQDTRGDMNELGRTEELVTPSLVEAIRVFLWSASAHKDGNIKAAGIDFSTEPPALTIDCGGMDYKTYDFSQAFKDLIGGLVSAPGQISDLTSKVQEIGDKATELSKDIPGKVKAAGLSPLDNAKATGYAGANFKTVAAGVAKAPKVLKEAGDALADVKALLPKVKELIAGADEVGKKAAEKGQKKMDEIFDHFQTAPKKTPEQIKAEQKGKKPKKAGKKKAKKGQEGKDGKAAEKQGKAGEEHGKAGEEHGKAGEEQAQSEVQKPVAA